MPIIYGLLNCTTNEKVFHRRDTTDDWRDGLPCGVYKVALYEIGHYDHLMRLECKACDGTGGGEEVSGGHKKECEACCGSGIDPAKLNEFERLPINSDRCVSPQLVPRWTWPEPAHGNCKNCMLCYQGRNLPTWLGTNDQ